MHLRWFLLSLTLFSSVLTTRPAWAHAHDGEDEAELTETLARYAEIARFAEQVRVQSAVTPYLHVAGQWWPVNGPLWNLTQAWLRLNYQGVQRECDNCIPIPEEEFVAEAKALAAKGFFRVKLGEPAMEGLEHIVMGAADIGAQFGVTAASAKVAAELFETVASMSIGLKGVHLLCHAIDFAILFLTRNVNTAIHVFNWAPTLGGSRLAAIGQMAYISTALARAQRKVRFVKGPVYLSPEELKEVDLAGPRRWWGWLPDGKRAKWLRKLDKKGVGTLSRAQALGHRRLRYAMLRISGKDVAGTTPMDNALNQRSPIWIMSVQENVAQRAFKPTDVAPAEVESLADRFTSDTDDIRQGLAEEFGGADEGKARLLAGVLRDIEVIFNPAVPRRVRYFHALTMESLLYGYMYKQFRRTLVHASELHEVGAKGYGGKLRATWRQFKLRMRAGRFANYILDVGDYLRVAAMRGNAEELAAKKFETMESVKRIFDTFQLSGEMARVTDVEGLNDIENKLAAARTELMNFRPWAEKRTAYSWFPWRRPVPMCHEMSQLVFE